MKRKQTAGSPWPAFDSLLLQQVAAAFLLRRKAIRYKSFSWGDLLCERNFSETAHAASERLNLDLGRLHLSVWEDGAISLRFCVANPGKNTGWAFNDCFHGSIQDVSPEALVAMFETTIAHFIYPHNSDPQEYHERLRTIWRHVHPYTE